MKCPPRPSRLSNDEALLGVRQFLFSFAGVPFGTHSVLPDISPTRREIGWA
ncbi:hypothetical protein Rleg4DRAFT_1175 [Rhizobium leguminosarum bv. trifolii WSM2297]|uniref:Uncharacterized protein n=1 Tax=Rhizobium leguminosarum bv. trifolii WSM2297 TaxID=754762 RepID=J0KPZ7_RHILT|nr:hypothetical protein Rleg4DRAFT_1175 [Rhizobium leguminosarum bv. trifolii WSM2297]